MRSDDRTAQARIYRPSRAATQSGRGRIRAWVLEYEARTPRRPEPLMGWSSSGDTLNQIKLRFDSMEDAIAYCEREGLTYQVDPEHRRRVRPRNYADNFKPRPS